MSSSPNRRRLRFDNAEILQEAGESRVRVSFALGEELVQADAVDSSGANSVLKAAAEATLKAVRSAAANRFACSLADLDHVKALGKNLIAVLVDVDFEGRGVQVFGSCQIAGSEIDCSVKATLNAINRIFELATRDLQSETRDS